MKISVFSKIACLAIAFIATSSLMQVDAQSKIDVDLSADLVNSYVWRGIKTAGASVQPSLNATVSGFTLGAWASTDIGNAGTKEVDFSASYEKSGFKVAATDYWWDGEGANRYFSNPHEGYSGHMLEATLGYTLVESFPLSVTWNTFLLGKGNKKASGDNSYSTYIELAYPFSVKGVDLGIAAGFTPWESTIYQTDGFAFTSVMLNASKSIKITDSFSLPIFATLICNPEKEDIHFVFGFTIQ